MAAIPPNWVNQTTPYFVDQAELASSIITAQIAIGADGYLYMEQQDVPTASAQIQFELNDAGTNYNNLGVQRVNTNGVVAKVVSVTNDILKFDNFCVGRLKVAGNVDIGVENVGDITADTNGNIIMAKGQIDTFASDTAIISSLTVSTINGSFPVPQVPSDLVVSSITTSNSIITPGIQGSLFNAFKQGSYDYIVNVESTNGNTTYKNTWHDTTAGLDWEYWHGLQPQYSDSFPVQGRTVLYKGGSVMSEMRNLSTGLEFYGQSGLCAIMSNNTIYAENISTGTINYGSMTFSNASVPSLTANNISAGTIFVSTLVAQNQTFSNAVFPTFDAGFISSGTTQAEFVRVIDNISFYNPSSIVAGGWIREDQYGNLILSTLNYVDIWTETRALRLMGATLDGDQSAARLSTIQTNYLSSGSAYISSLVADEVVLPPVTQLTVPSISTNSISSATSLVSTLNADYISSTVARISSLVADEVVYPINNWIVPSISTNSISTTTVQASAVSTLGLIASTLTLAQGTSTSQMYIGGAVIPGTGSVPTVYINNDVSLLQNDLYCQQLRIGYGNVSSQPSELIMYAPNLTTSHGLNVGNNDRTIRIQSTINATSAGYILDTTVNPPFFSTIGTTTNMVSYFPSTTAASIGYSTITTIPQYIGSWYSSTSQTVVGANTQTPLTYNSQSLNVGGFSYTGSTITVPVAGNYEINASIQFNTTTGSQNVADFWFLKNGTALPWSASRTTVANNAQNVATCIVYDTAAAGDKYAINIQSTDANMSAGAFPVSGNVPGIPSVITNIRRLG